MAGIVVFPPLPDTAPPKALHMVTERKRAPGLGDAENDRRIAIMSKNVKRSVTLDCDTMDALNTIAAKKHITVSELLREYIGQGLSTEYSDKQQEEISRHIRSAVDASITAAMKPYIERIAAICAKTNRYSAIAVTGLLKEMYEYFDHQYDTIQILATLLEEADTFVGIRRPESHDYFDEADIKLRKKAADV